MSRLSPTLPPVISPSIQLPLAPPVATPSCHFPFAPSAGDLRGLSAPARAPCGLWFPFVSPVAGTPNSPRVLSRSLLPAFRLPVLRRYTDALRPVVRVSSRHLATECLVTLLETHSNLTKLGFVSLKNYGRWLVWH
ncbi:unnamed protein product [Chondrus crispus]|uniref:Uncharacterized protein n=1 Tax=Chondrus crispus TaxID=2769 RepID=R7QPL9_CHOCR|nr:unnamed protein product [Chondrus crispus]XP_005713242.1 unnamed protein product [Chondrus crispus]CDF33439.1 unnamed protein product [Chondrus crispus]CDF40432.1 unnamed protein product [Chondrus crispus]|eukprot:XP_005710726.1 unnamed protein product [Chondrus crispus]